jgi:signal transduction histidine kinase
MGRRISVLGAGRVTGSKRRSLVWTVAVAFFLTAALATLFQWIVATKVLQPLETREARSRAEVVAVNTAADLSAAPALQPGADLDSLLARRRIAVGGRPDWIAFRRPDGTVISDPPSRSGNIVRILAATPSASGVVEVNNLSRTRRGPSRFEILAKRRVRRGDEVLGEVFVLRPLRPPGGPLGFGSPTSLLFLPISVIASAISGLIIVRLLSRRLRSIEKFASRVAEGDLSARIGDTSGDEIGRIASRLDRMTERLAEAREEIQENERQRRRLFADITHELATPLTAIRGTAETMLNPEVRLSEGERISYVRGMLEEARRLDRLTRDLFDLARLEAGASPLHLEPLDWVALCRNTSDRFVARFHAAGLTLSWGESVGSALIAADGHRLEQVLENLLANALRYVPEGGTVGLSLVAANGPGRRFRLSVTDDGPGIAPEDLPHAFERFYRAPGAREQAGSSDDTGSGLGLAIVREIVERHGGAVRAELREPHGLSIVVELNGAGPSG